MKHTAVRAHKQRRAAEHGGDPSQVIRLIARQIELGACGSIRRQDLEKRRVWVEFSQPSRQLLPPGTREALGAGRVGKHRDDWAARSALRPEYLRNRAYAPGPFRRAQPYVQLRVRFVRRGVR